MPRQEVSVKYNLCVACEWGSWNNAFHSISPEKETYPVCHNMLTASQIKPWDVCIYFWEKMLKKSLHKTHYRIF